MKLQTFFRFQLRNFFKTPLNFLYWTANCNFSPSLLKRSFENKTVVIAFVFIDRHLDAWAFVSRPVNHFFILLLDVFFYPFCSTNRLKKKLLFFFFVSGTCMTCRHYKHIGEEVRLHQFDVDVLFSNRQIKVYLIAFLQNMFQID